MSFLGYSAVRNSETLVYFSGNTRCYIPEMYQVYITVYTLSSNAPPKVLTVAQNEFHVRGGCKYSFCATPRT